MYKKFNVSWATVSLTQKAFIEEITRVNYKRELAKRSFFLSRCGTSLISPFLLASDTLPLKSEYKRALHRLHQLSLADRCEGSFSFHKFLNYSIPYERARRTIYCIKDYGRLAIGRSYFQ